MSNLTYVRLVNNNQYNQGVASAGVLANSGSLTTISPGGEVAGQALTLSGNTLQVGQQYRVRARGALSTTGAPNLTLALTYGGTGGTILATTGANAAGSNLSNAWWLVELDLRVDAVGTAGTIRTMGNGLLNGVDVGFPTAVSGGNAVAVDTSATKVLTLAAQWGTADSRNSITCFMFMVERLNEGGS